jgi:hypothetical protein
MAKKDYNAINFKNKDVDKLSGKFNNGDPIPAPAYTKGKSSNFAGTDRKREPVIPETKGTGKAVSTVRGAGNVTPAKVENKSRLERQMGKYGVEPASGNNSPSLQKKIDKRNLASAKKDERKGDSKSRLERQMDKYGVEPASSKNSPSQQRVINKAKLNLAKDKERASIPTPGMDKVRDKVNKVLGRGKYDRGSMDKNMSTGGNRSKVCVDKFGQRSQDKACNMKMGEKFGRTGKKTPKNTQWTITK